MRLLSSDHKLCELAQQFMADENITQRSYKFRIYPSRAQTTRMNGMLALLCELYNAGLQERRDAYRVERKSIRYIDQQNQLPEIKEIRPELKEIHSQILQDVLRRLDTAFQSFFRRVKERAGCAGFPRFRSRHRYNSFTYTQSGFTIRSGKLQLSKIGQVKIKLHRPVEGKIKTLTITRSTTGKWYASLSVEMEAQPLPATDTAIGIDVGLTHFATLSTGEKINNPRFFRLEEKRLSNAGRKLSATPKGSILRRKHRKIVASIHERITNKRRNFAHHESRKLVNKFGLIALENLNIEGMVKNHTLAKSISDAAWNQFVQYVTYKAAWAGRRVVLVDPRNTSQQCSACGAIVPKDLSERIHHCSCGLTLDRDHNAALNILALGLQCVGLRAIEAALL